MKEDCRNVVHSVAWVAPEKKKEKENWHETDRQREKERGRERVENKTGKNQCKDLSPVLGRSFPPPLFTLSFISA